MITQLLRTTVVPAEYKLRVQHAQLKIKQDFQPVPEINASQGEMKIQTTPTTATYDGRQMRKSLGFQNVDDIIDEAVQKGQQSISKTTQDHVQFGKEVSQPGKGVTIPELMRQKMFGEVSEKNNIGTVFLPQSSTDISWHPGNVDVEYNAGDMNFDWAIHPPEYTYIPGDVRLELIEHARVEVEYLGGPLYFPPSADPNYEES